MLDFNTAERQGLTVIDNAAWEARLDRLRASLRQQACQLVREIFPRARLQQHEARIGSVAGDAGESLAVALTGDSAGLWHDHATGEGGDLIDLWLQTQGYGVNQFAQAVDDLERWCGLSPAPRFTSAVAKVSEARKAEAAKEPKLDQGLGAPVANYHYLSADGQLLGIVRRYHLANGKKTFLQFNSRGEPHSPDPRPLYRLPQIRTADTVVLVEGEKCADALAAVGIEATSAMGGAKALLEKIDWAPLAGKTVLLWPDNDAPGREFVARVEPILRGLGCVVATVAVPTGKPEKWDAADAVAEGEDVAAIVGTAKPSRSETEVVQRRKLRILDIDALDALKPPSWLIDGVIPQGAFASLYGAPGAAKSFVAVDLSLCVATGRDWHGRAVKGGYVLYVAGEGQAGMQKRILGWRAARQPSTRPAFGLVPQAVAMPTGQLDELLGLIRDLPAPPVLVVLDTVARTFGPGDENSQKDMNAYVAAVDRLRDATGAAVLALHHTGKDDARGMRGSSALTGAVDTSIYVKRSGSSVTLVNKAPHGKQKDAEEFEDIALCSVKTEFDHQGQRATTLILMPDEAVVSDGAPTKSEKGQRLGPVEQSIMTALEGGARAGQSLGFMRLLAVVGCAQGSLSKALSRMSERGLIIETEEGGRKVWVLP
jgi:hypothetical protein